MTPKRKRILKWAGLTTGGLIVLLFTIAMIGQYWLVPSIIRSQLQSELAEVWAGPVDVGAVRFRFFGPIRLASLAMRDQAGRTWLEMHDLELHLDRWPSASPVVSAVRIDKLSAEAHVTNGKCDWPFIKSKSTKPLELEKYLDLRQAEIRQLFVGVTGLPQGRIVQDLVLNVGRNGQADDVSLRPSNGGDDPISLTGWIKGDLSDARLALHVSRQVDPALLGALLSLAGAGPAPQVAGRLSLDVTASGPLTKPQALQLSGSATLADGVVDIQGFPLTRQIAIEVTVADRSVRITNFKASSCDGTLAAQGQADFTFDGGLKYYLSAQAESLDLGLLTGTFSNPPAIRRGRADLAVELHGAAPTLAALRGQAVVKIRDADFSAAESSRTIFERIGLAKQMALITQLDATVNLEGGLVRIESARVGDGRVTDVRVAQGGTVDTSSGKLNLDVLVVPIDRLKALGPNVPGVALVTGLADSLTSFRIQGDYNKPDGISVTPMPAEAVARIAPNLLKGIVDNGQEFGRGAAKLLNSLLKPFETNTDDQPASQSTK